MYSAEKLRQVLEETFVDALDFHDEIESTNSRALQLAREGLGDQRCILVLTERQTAGRGRGANRWWSSPGALTFSVLVDTQALALPVSRWPLVSLTTGLAVCEAVDFFLKCSPDQSRLKWPNDVFLRGRKLCGILVEGADHRVGALVIGIGVNVNNSYATAPVELQQTAIALCDVLGIDVEPSDLLNRMLKQLEMRLTQLAVGKDDLRALWQQRCLLTGRQIHVETHAGPVTGICRGIDRDGALLVESTAGSQRILSGVISSFA